VGRRGHGQQVGDEAFVEVTADAVVHLPAVVGRPVPEEFSTSWFSEIPIPFDFLPQLGGAATNLALDRILAVEILARGEKRLDQEGRFDQVVPIIEARKRNRFARAPVQPMRPDAMIAPGLFFQKNEHLQNAGRSGWPRDKTAFSAHQDGHDTEARSTNRDFVRIAKTLARQAADRMSVLVEATEGRLLHRGEQFPVAHGA